MTTPFLEGVVICLPIACSAILSGPLLVRPIHALVREGARNLLSLFEGPIPSDGLPGE